MKPLIMHIMQLAVMILVYWRQRFFDPRENYFLLLLMLILNTIIIYNHLR